VIKNGTSFIGAGLLHGFKPAISRNINTRFNLKKGVYGLATGIDGSYPGGGKDYHFLVANLLQVSQKGGFACSCSTGQVKHLRRI
jgi:hypothetical protein